MQRTTLRDLLGKEKQLNQQLNEEVEKLKKIQRKVLDIVTEQKKENERLKAELKKLDENWKLQMLEMKKDLEKSQNSGERGSLEKALNNIIIAQKKAMAMTEEMEAEMQRMTHMRTNLSRNLCNMNFWWNPGNGAQHMEEILGELEKDTPQTSEQIKTDMKRITQDGNIFQFSLGP